MHGKTAFQKIVESHCLKTLLDGRMVLKLDWVWGHEITTPNAILDAVRQGCDVVFDPNRVKTMIDHVSPAKDTASALQGKILREWSKRHQIEFLEVGRNGICHAVIPEKGWIRPGQIGIMGDSHTCTLGAFCAFTAGVGTSELESAIITGLWICPAQKVIRVKFFGKLPANVYSKDLILTLIKKIGVKGATNAVLEFSGSVIEQMSMESRMTITNMAVEAGATCGMMMVDQKTIDYLGLVGEDWAGWNSDPNAIYDRTIEIDVSKMVPVITDNYSPAEVVPVRKLAGKSVNQVYIGSCTNARLEDLRIAATIFRLMQAKVAEDVRCIIVPATQHIYKLALEEGLIETFVKAGCYVCGPTCGACLGMSCGVIAPGEVCVSTTNRNFRGRMGEGGMVHLVSPATAAMTAIKGVIFEPPADLCARISSIVSQMPVKRLTSLTGWKEVPSKRPKYSQFLTLFNRTKAKKFSGKVFYLPIANIDTDQIIPAKYLNEIGKDKLGRHCLEAAPISVEVRSKIFSSQVLLAGENFGCGSSREHAVWALESAGIRCVIAPSFARIFEENMFGNGLLCITLPKEAIESLNRERPKSVVVNWEEGIVRWGEKIAKFKLSKYQKELIRNGGGLGFMIKLASELQKKGELI